MATLRVSEKEAKERGWVSDTEVKADPGPEAGKRLYQDTLARHRKAAASDRTFIFVMVFIAGWLAGFACALLFIR